MDSKFSDDLKLRFTLAETMAKVAGALALDYFQRRDTLIIEEKRNPQDVVSDADRNVEKLIREHIHRECSQDGILGEEYGLEAGSSGFVWVIDPIDGTSPFVNGMPSWCVSIGLVFDGEPVLGIINAPVLGETYRATKGEGAFLNDRRLAMTPTRTVQNGVTGIGANGSVSPALMGKIVETLLEKGGSFVRNGSGALMLAYVAADRLVGYYEPYMHAWDCIAAYCIIAEAGGTCRPFPTEGEAFLKGAPVLAAGPGALNDLEDLASL
ncbi:inositol monophosphatase family protein [Oryzifoliimicrobium ureilyticus]|uniref:inositol monophosphatase family protein n=1 Tax=Oryzifoliimicrobium ureilyticus TaxID=3113724 RepID=UPI0030762E43